MRENQIELEIKSKKQLTGAMIMALIRTHKVSLSAEQRLIGRLYRRAGIGYNTGATGVVFYKMEN